MIITKVFTPKILYVKYICYKVTIVFKVFITL